jgi:D-psicose/D-tagatose/L-ribulose 3-epimerase
VKVAFNLLVIGGEITPAHAPQLERLKALGYDAVEVPVFTGSVDGYRQTGRLLREIGLTAGVATSVPPEANPISGDAAVRAKRAITTAGSSIVPKRWMRRSLQARSIRLSASLAAPARRRRKSTVAWTPCARLPNMPRRLGSLFPPRRSTGSNATSMSTIAQASEIYRRVDHPNFGYMFDTFHANIEEKDPPATYERYHREINHYHISENDRGVPGVGPCAVSGAFRCAAPLRL